MKNRILLFVFLGFLASLISNKSLGRPTEVVYRNGEIRPASPKIAKPYAHKLKKKKHIARINSKRIRPAEKIRIIKSLDHTRKSIANRYRYGKKGRHAPTKRW